MKLIACPRQGIQIYGKEMINFGMSRQTVRQFFTEQPEELQHGDNTIVDLYAEIPLRFSYDTTGKFTYVDIFYDSTCTLLLNNFDLFSTSFGRVKEIIEEVAQEPMVENSVGMWTSQPLCITVHHQLEEDEWFSGPVEIICLFQPEFMEQHQ
jgi:hypothetical protein